MLGILSLASGAVEAHPAGAPGRSTSSRIAIFDIHVEEMLARGRPRMTPGARARFLYLLGWLARRMTEHRQTQFLLEEMQPSWLAPG